MSNQRTVNSIEPTPLWEKITAFLFGAIFLATFLVIAIIFPNPTPFQYTIFRIILSLACAGVAAVIPGFLSVRTDNLRIVIRAGGAIAVFVIVYLLNPAQLAVQKQPVAHEMAAAQRRQEKIAVIKDFMKDLERIKVLIPSQQPLTDCLKQTDNNKVSYEQFKEKYESCVSKNKYSDDHALTLLDRNLSALKLAFDDSEFKSIIEDINAIRFSIYEMHNNRLVLETWFNNSCSRFISFIKKTQFDKLPTDDTGEPRCALIVQGYEQFLQGRDTNKNDNISVIIKRKINADQFHYFIVEGDQNTIDDYFLNMNNEHYNKMTSSINSLLDKFKSIRPLAKVRIAHISSS